MKVFNLEAMRSAEIQEEPFKYAVIKNLVHNEFEAQMIQVFPEHQFVETVRETGEKPYRMFHRSFIDKDTGKENISDLTEIWRNVYDDLTSDQYRNFMSNLTGIDLSQAILGASFWKYSYDCYLSVHTDKQEKLVTQLIYLEEDWEESWGGCLHLHNSNSEKEVIRSITPKIENSVVLVTSPNSWHSVTPVSHNRRSRRSLQIVFWKQS